MKSLLYILTALVMTTAPALASEDHPVREILTVSSEIDMDRIDICRHTIETSPLSVDSEPECDYLAREGAKVLTIMVNTLTAEGQEITKENRHNIPSIAWDNLSMFEMGSMALTAFELSDSAIYIGKNHPDMVAKYMSAEVLELLNKGGII